MTQKLKPDPIEPGKEIEAVEEFNTVIELSNGSIASRKPLKGSHFFKFQAMTVKNAADAMKWVVMQAFLLDGKPLTIDVLLDLPFVDAATLATEISKDFTAYQDQVNS